MFTEKGYHESYYDQAPERLRVNSVGLSGQGFDSAYRLVRACMEMVICSERTIARFQKTDKPLIIVGEMLNNSTEARDAFRQGLRA